MLFEEKLIFFPELYPLGDWSPKLPAGFELEEFYISSGSFKLHGWFITPDKILFDAAVLFCHGNAGNLTTRLAKSLALAGCGVPVFIFDYRGYGKSDPVYVSEKSISEDSRAAYDWLVKKGYSEDKIVIHGISLGGGVGCYLSSKFNPAALSLESTFTSIPDMCRKLYPFIPRFLVKTRFDNLARIQKLKLPVQIIHGTDDELIPYSMGRQLFEAIRHEKKWFIEVNGAGHGDLLEKAGELYSGSFLSFLKKVFN